MKPYFDSNGNIIVAGSTLSADQQSDALLLNYASSGGGSFTFSTQNGIGDNTENIRDFGFDAQGNIYVTGYSVGKDADRNLCLVKLNAAGDTLWSRSITGTLYGSDEEANKIFVSSNAVIISGYVKNSGTISFDGNCIGGYVATNGAITARMFGIDGLTATDF